MMEHLSILFDLFGSLYEFLVPFFFVMIGMKIQPGLLLSSSVYAIIIFMVVATTVVTPLFLSFFARHWHVR